MRTLKTSGLAIYRCALKLKDLRRRINKRTVKTEAADLPDLQATADLPDPMSKAPKTLDPTAPTMELNGLFH